MQVSLPPARPERRHAGRPAPLLTLVLSSCLSCGWVRRLRAAWCQETGRLTPVCFLIKGTRLEALFRFSVIWHLTRETPGSRVTSHNRSLDR